MAVGNPGAIDALMRIKSNLDSGVPQAIQYAAIAALRGPQECIKEHNVVYQKRRDKLLQTIARIGLKASPPKASLYVWAGVPAGYSSADFTTRLLDEASVVVTPGTGYGKAGEGYVRFSLTLQDDRFAEGIKRLSSFGEKMARR